MISFKNLLEYLVFLNLIVLAIFMMDLGLSDPKSNQSIHVPDLIEDFGDLAPIKSLINKDPSVTKPKVQKKKIERIRHINIYKNEDNPFFLLGGYRNLTSAYFNSYNNLKPLYNKTHYGLFNNNSYCAHVDIYNIENRNNLFKDVNFFTDYGKSSLIRKKALPKLGKDLSKRISVSMSKKLRKKHSIRLNPEINIFFTRDTEMHVFHKLGVNFLCATQLYNHIPGNGVISRRDFAVGSASRYHDRYKNKPECFSKETFMPKSYRLYNKEECNEFFSIIQSDEYKSRSNSSIQYILKTGLGSTTLLDDKQYNKIVEDYQNGTLCGLNEAGVIAQKHLDNLIFKDGTKFDISMYLLVASTNPMIAYYTDGFVRANGLKLEVNSTNSQKVDSLSELENHMRQLGLINQENWLATYLRPKIKNYLIHVIRMSQRSFWKQSNVFELFEVDFMIDNNLQLWFEDCSSLPDFSFKAKNKQDKLIHIFKDMFEIVLNHYRSRMKRVLSVIQRFKNQKNENPNIEKLQLQYEKADANYLDPDYEISPDNLFQKIIDRNLPMDSRYFGSFNVDCIDDVN